MSKEELTDIQSTLRLSSEDESWQDELEWESATRLKQCVNIWRPPTDMYETDKAYVVVVEVAGMCRDDFNIAIERQVLSISGIRYERGGSKSYHQIEIAYGEFATSVKISAIVDVSSIKAIYSDGFLRVVLPKGHPKEIAITDKK